MNSKKTILSLIIVLVLCSCAGEVKSVIKPTKPVTIQKPTYSGSYYYNSDKNTIEYFDDITHDLRQLLYTYYCEDSNFDANKIQHIRFVLVGDYEKLVNTIEYMINCGLYEVYVDFNVDNSKSPYDMATELVSYYFDTCNIQHNKITVLKVRENQKAFFFDKVDSNYFIGYFEDSNYETLNIADIKKEIKFIKYNKL